LISNDELLQELTKRLFIHPMNMKAAATYLCISRSSMSKIVTLIPHSVIAGRRVFLKTDLDAYIKEQRL